MLDVYIYCLVLALIFKFVLIKKKLKKNFNCCKFCKFALLKKKKEKIKEEEKK